MKNLYIILTITAMFGCSSNNLTYFSYSPDFKVVISTNDLISAKIYSSDGVSIKFSDNSSLSGLLITKDIDGLSSNFNIHDYPKYILGVKKLEGLSRKETDLFANSLDEIKYTYHNQAVNRFAGNSKEIYILCSDNLCLSFIVKLKNKEQILMLSSTNVSQQKFTKIVKGIK